MYKRAIRYVCSEESFRKTVFTKDLLEVIAIKDDGEITRTNFLYPISSARISEDPKKYYITLLDPQGKSPIELNVI